MWIWNHLLTASFATIAVIVFVVIMKMAFVERRCKLAVDAGLRMISLGMNIGGFPLKVSSMLYKTFIRSKLEAGIS